MMDSSYPLDICTNFETSKNVGSKIMGENVVLETLTFNIDRFWIMSDGAQDEWTVNK